MSTTEPIHALAWTAWLAATVVALSITRNPIYLALILLWIAVVTLALSITQSITNTPAANLVPLSPLQFGMVVVPLTALFNGLNVHIGTNVLFTLPASLPIIGGPITLEALVYGALNGLVLTGLLSGFLALHRGLTVRSLVRLIPRAYYPVAVVVLIAITFVPVTLQQFQRIREAQAIRGHRVRGIRSWQPLFVPLLMGGMERALQLAEAMTARGFASSQISHSPLTQLMLLIGLLSAGGGIMLRSVLGILQPGLILIIGGSALIVGVLWYLGRQQPYTTYRPSSIRAHDWFIITAALLMSLLFLPTGIVDRTSLFYYPYPTLMLPQFHIGIGLATWGILPPALVLFVFALRIKSGDKS